MSQRLGDFFLDTQQMELSLLARFEVGKAQVFFYRLDDKALKEKSSHFYEAVSKPLALYGNIGEIH